jgi:hypothetical protein
MNIDGRKKFRTLIYDKLNDLLKMKDKMSDEDVATRLIDLPKLTLSAHCKVGEVCASGLLAPECLQIYDDKDKAIEFGNKDLKEQEKGKYGKTVAFRNIKLGKLPYIASCLPFQTFFFHNNEMKCKNPEKNPDKRPTAKTSTNLFNLAHGQYCYVFIKDTTCSCGTTSITQCMRGQMCQIYQGQGKCYSTQVYYGCAEGGNCYCTEKSSVIRVFGNNKDNYCYVNYFEENGKLVNQGKYFEDYNPSVAAQRIVHLTPEIISAQMFLVNIGVDPYVEYIQPKLGLLQERALRVKKTLRAIV